MANVIKIRIEGDGSNLQVFDDAGKKLAGVTDQAHKLKDALEMGVGIDLGGKIVESLREIPRVIEEAISEGIRFNTEMETMRLTLAGMVKQFSGGEVKTFADGLKVSDGIIEKMRGTANELGISFGAMLETYKTTASVLFNSGVTDLQRQVDLTVLLTKTMQGLGIHGFQATRDIQDLLAGMANRTKAGRELGIKDEDIEKAKEAGQLYEFLEERLSGFADASAAGIHTMTAETERLKNLWEQFLGIVTKPMFDEARDGLQALNEQLKDGKTNAETLGIAVSTAIGSLKHADDNGILSGLLKVIERGVGLNISGPGKEIIGQAWEKAKNEQLRNELGGLPASITDEAEHTPVTDSKKIEEIKKRLDDSIKKIDDGLTDRVYGNGDRADFAQTILGALLKIRDRWNDIAGAEASTFPKQKQIADEAEKEAKSREKAAAAAEKVAGAVDKAFEAHADKLGTPQDRVQTMSERMQKLRSELDEQYKKSTPVGDISGMGLEDAKKQIELGGVGDGDKAALLTKLAEILKLEEQITAEAEKQTKEGEATLKNDEQKADRRKQALEDLKYEQSILEAELSGNTALVQQLQNKKAVLDLTAKLIKDNVPEAEAKKHAEITGELQKQVALLKQKESLDKVLAQNAVDNARTPKQKAEADINKIRTDSYYELKGKGLPDDQVNDIIGDRMDQYRRAHKGNKIGGPTEHSPLDELGDGKNHLGQVDHPLDQRPGGAGESPADRPLGKTPDQSWNDIFKRGIAPMVPVPQNRPDEQQGPPAPPPQPKQEDNKPAGGGGGGGAAGAAADSLQKGGSDLGAAAGKLQAAATAIQTAVGQLGTATSGLTNLGPAITQAFQSLKQSIDDLQSQINDLQNS